MRSIRLLLIGFLLLGVARAVAVWRLLNQSGNSTGSWSSTAPATTALIGGRRRTGLGGHRPQLVQSAR